MTHIEPVVGDWYKRPGGHLFEVVAVDTEDGTIEVQHFDGTVEEIETESWEEIVLEAAHPPEDYSGSVDIEREDVRLETDEVYDNNVDHLQFVDRAE